MRAEKLEIVKSVLGHGYMSGGEHLFHCPFCDHHKRKLSVNIDKDVFKCWICDATGRIGKVVRKLGTREDRNEWSQFEDRVEITDFDSLFREPETPVEQRVELPKGFTSLATRKPPEDSWGALRHLSKRGIERADILKWKIGYCTQGEYAGRVIIPSFNHDGYVNYFVARSYGRDWPKYKNPPASRNITFNELYVDWKNDIVIVEGVFYAIKAGNAIPLLGSTLRPNSKLFEAIVKSGQRIYLALDDDAKQKEDRIGNLLLSYGVDVWKVDTSSFDDVGEMTKKDFMLRKKNASPIRKENYLLQRLATI